MCLRWIDHTRLLFCQCQGGCSPPWAACRRGLPCGIVIYGFGNQHSATACACACAYAQCLFRSLEALGGVRVQGSELLACSIFSPALPLTLLGADVPGLARLRFELVGHVLLDCPINMLRRCLICKQWGRTTLRLIACKLYIDRGARTRLGLGFAMLGRSSSWTWWCYGCGWKSRVSHCLIVCGAHTGRRPHRSVWRKRRGYPLQS